MADKQMEPQPGFWRQDQELSSLLAFLVLMTIFVPMVGESRPGRIAIDLTFALMLLSGAIATVRKADADVSHHRAHHPGIHGGPDRRIQPLASAPGAGTLPSRCCAWPFSWS